MRNNTLIKFIAVFALLTMIATSALADPTTDVIVPRHTCVFTNYEWVTYPTCFSTGLKRASCDAPNCGQHDDMIVVKVECDFQPATCTQPSMCEYGCGATRGEPLGHNYITNVNCMTYVYCSRCNDKTNELGNHYYASATCTEPATCIHCGVTHGSANGHYYYSATCQEPATCRDCGDTTGSKREHNYVNNRCTMCGRQSVSINSSETEGEIE